MKFTLVFLQNAIDLVPSLSCVKVNFIKEKTLQLFEKWDCSLIEINYEADHIHILFEAPPQVQLSKIINSYKTATSRLIRKNFEEHLKAFYWKDYFWSRSYFIISTGGAPIDIIKEYIKNQGK